MAGPAIVSKNGPKVKGYLFADKLGSGTYATVYKAFRQGGQREVVAIKCIEKSSLNRMSTENLLTEIELLKHLKHPHIVQLKDFQWDDHHIYLIMEFCSGGDLGSFIRSRRTLSQHMAKRFLQQLASALEYMRSKNVSHMDLKPPNILLSSQHSPTLKIADFGFAHYLIGDTEAVIMRGSPLYMAPEIILKRQYNEKADLWSTGVILYECLFGRAPFHSKTIEELESKIKENKPIEIPYGVQLSDSCRDLLTGLLKRDVDSRMSYEEFLQHPYLDLKHRPCAEAFDKAHALVTKAVQYDTNNDYSEAVTHYCEALEYFVPAIHYETDATKKKLLRQKVSEYMQRAEHLQHLLKPSDTSERGESSSGGGGATRGEGGAALSYTNLQLGEVYNDNPRIQSVIKVVECARSKLRSEDYDGAFQQYENALGPALQVLHGEVHAERKTLLQKQVTQWMSEAERIKTYLDVRKMTIRNNLKKEEMEQSVSGANCVVQ